MKYWRLGANISQREPKLEPPRRGQPESVRLLVLEIGNWNRSASSPLLSPLACCVCVSRSDGQTKPVRLQPHHKTRQRTSLLKKSCLVARDFENGNAGVRGNKQREAMKLDNFIQNRGSWPVNGQAGKQPFFGDSKLLQKCPSGKYRKKAAFIPSAYLSIINLRGFIKNVGPRDRLRKSFWNANPSVKLFMALKLMVADTIKTTSNQIYTT